MEKNKLYKLSKDVLGYWLLIITFKMLFAIILAWIISANNLERFVFYIYFIISVTTILSIYKYIKFINVSFIINDNELILNYGIIIKHSKIIILSKIQNINIGQGIIEKYFNIKSIRIWTASQEQIYSSQARIKTEPALILWLKNDDINSFKSLLNKI